MALCDVCVRVCVCARVAFLQTNPLLARCSNRPFACTCVPAAAVIKGNEAQVTTRNHVALPPPRPRPLPSPSPTPPQPNPHPQCTAPLALCRNRESTQVFYYQATFCFFRLKGLDRRPAHSGFWGGGGGGASPAMTFGSQVNFSFLLFFFFFQN